MGIGAAGGSAGGLEIKETGRRGEAGIRARAEDILDEAHKEKEEANEGRGRKGGPRWVLNVGQGRSPASRRNDSL
jgi:hypothetical protein